MIQFDAEIKSNTKIADSFYHLELSWPDTEQPVPGNFLTLRVSDDTVPLLRRPFAFSGFDTKSSSCSLIYQKRGHGTDILAGKQKGEKIDLIGPLGKPFPTPDTNAQITLVAGGIGIGPMLFLASMLHLSGYNFTFVFGCRTKSFIPDLGQFRSLDPVICTDDGSCGFKGTTGDYLKSIESTLQHKNTIYCCGPHPMLKACHETALRTEGTCWVSVEQIMACGVGACMGCAVKTKDTTGYARACKEGPVFSSDHLLWE